MRYLFGSLGSQSKTLDYESPALIAELQARATRNYSKTLATTPKAFGAALSDAQPVT